MLVLGMDTATSVCSAAVVKDGNARARIQGDGARHAEAS